MPLANWQGQFGTDGSFQWEVVPLWKNAFNQTNFTGTLDQQNLQLTTAAENNDVPSPRAIATMQVQYNLAGSAPSGTGGSSAGGSGQTNP